MKTVVKTIVWFSLTTAGTLSADTYQEGKVALEHHDYGTAIEKLSSSCDDKNPLGCFDLAALSDSGTGLAQNKYAAHTLYAKACTLGYSKGCANLANGYDVP